MGEDFAGTHGEEENRDGGDAGDDQAVEAERSWQGMEEVAEIKIVTSGMVFGGKICGLARCFWVVYNCIPDPSATGRLSIILPVMYISAILDPWPVCPVDK